MNKLREILMKRGQAIDGMTALSDLALKETRDLTEDEQKQFADLEKQVATLDAQAERMQKLHDLGTIAVPEEERASLPATAISSQPDQPIYRGSKATKLGQQLMDIRAMSMPGISPNEYRDASSRLEQCRKRDEMRAAATGGFTIDVPSDGAFTLQGDVSMVLMTNGFNNSEVLSRCQKRTLTPGTQFVAVVGIDETSRATGSRGGGIRVYTSRELEELTVSKTKFNWIRLEPKKLTGAYVASSEVLQNITFLGQEMTQLFAEEFSFKVQDLVINGSGAGEPLGILNSPCLVTQAKETGQAADTIITRNITKMETRMWQDRPGLVYLINRECKVQLSELSIAVGTAGSLVPLYQQQFYMGLKSASLNGTQCVTIEQAAALGDLGDIMLCDFSQYLLVDRGNVQEESSVHVYFLYDQSVFRFIYYVDGQPRWSSAVTPYKGSSTVSPFVALAARA